MSDKLRGLSDEDLNRLYNDAKAGIRSGTSYVENDGDDTGGYSQLDFYTGQSMSSDHTRGGYDEDELMELSELYENNVYTDYGGGRLGEEDIRKGFNNIFDEKERRRIKYIDDGRYKPPAEEEKEEVKQEEAAPPELSDKLKSAKERVSAYESEMRKPGSSSPYGAYGEQGTDDAPEAEFSSDTREAEEVQDDQQNKATSFLDKYKLDLKEGRKFQYK